MFSTSQLTSIMPNLALTGVKYSDWRVSARFYCLIKSQHQWNLYDSFIYVEIVHQFTSFSVIKL